MVADSSSKPAEAAINADRAASARNRLLAAPALLIVSVFGIFPLLIILVYSFLKAAPFGGVIWAFSTDGYVNFLFQRDIFDDSLQFTPDFLFIYLRSFIYALLTTFICLLLGFPTAYFMATRPPSQRNWWVLLITIPFWSNLLVRTLAIMFVIRDQGLINNVLIGLNLVDRPITMLYTNFAIMLGLLYRFCPSWFSPCMQVLRKWISNWSRPGSTSTPPAVRCCGTSSFHVRCPGLLRAVFSCSCLRLAPM
jgi:spermidine/putrescine transport system permease protein